MKETTKWILNDEELIENRNQWLKKLNDLFNGDVTGPVVLSGKVGCHCLGCGGANDTTDKYYVTPEDTLDFDMDTLAEQINKEQILKVNRFVPCVVEADFYGVHLVDKIFDANVFHDNDQWYVHYLATEIGKLEYPDLDNCEAWNVAKRYAEAFLNADVELPLLGMPVLSSPLNIAINLYGGKFLEAMVEEPEAAEHDLRIINDVIISLHRWYITHVPMERLQPTVGAWRTQPVGYGQLCGCSTHLVSPAMYKRFIMPLDDELLSQWPNGGMIHLCGSHKHLVPAFASMPHLRSLQLNDLATDQLEYYVNGLRDDQVIYLNASSNMPVERALQVAKGRKMVVVGDYEL